MVAQGGQAQGYALHFLDGGIPALDVRVRGQVTRLTLGQPVKGLVHLRAEFTQQTLSLQIGKAEPVTRPSPGWIPGQPTDILSIGRDELTAAGQYAPPHPFQGTILEARVETGPQARATLPKRPPPKVQGPHFVFLLTDDISPDDLPVYGNPLVQAPHLEKLAARGRVFDQAFLTISSCSPSRCSMITGRYPHNTGAPELHAPLPPEQGTFIQVLHDEGYHTVLSGKNHMAPPGQLGFDEASDSQPSGAENWVQHLKDRPTDRPFFGWFASHDAHFPFDFTDQAPRYDPEKVPVPPMLANGPLTREALSEYYHEVSRTDFYLGQVVAELERQGILDQTWIVYTSDNGRPFPRCKTYLYDSGIRTPLVVAGPGIRPGRTVSLLSSIDLAPTFLALAGLEIPKTIQGVSALPILQDPMAETRDMIFAERNWHVYQVHERAIRTRDWLYIWNAWPERHNVSGESAAYRFRAARELWEKAEAGLLTPAQALLTQVPQPSEMLFQVRQDPHQFHNLSQAPEHAGQIQELRTLLDRWKKETGDSIPAHPTPDRQPLHESREGGKLIRGDFPGADQGARQIQHPGPVRRMRKL